MEALGKVTYGRNWKGIRQKLWREWEGFFWRNYGRNWEWNKNTVFSTFSVRSSDLFPVSWYSFPSSFFFQIQRLLRTGPKNVIKRLCIVLYLFILYSDPDHKWNDTVCQSPRGLSKNTKSLLWASNLIVSQTALESN